MRLIDIVPKWAEYIHTNMSSELPIEPESVCQFLGIEYRRRSMHSLVDGLYYQTHNGIAYIVVNRECHQYGRMRFTAAHEIGHHLICRATRAKCRHYLDCCQTAHSPVEVAANRFAAELLMPKTLVLDFWHDLETNKRYRIEVMAERFGVSMSALRIRLEQLNLISSADTWQSRENLPEWQAYSF
jgi:Zn-dependent peptidase ImmA (M78 family)